MKYYLDCEFDGWGGPLISLALVRFDGLSLYLIYEHADEFIKDDWVAKHVIPILYDIPAKLQDSLETKVAQKTGAYLIAEFLKGDPFPYIIADWPDDISYFCKAIITGPGLMAAIPALQFEVKRVDAYPTGLEGAVQHNALWDALALRETLLPPSKRIAEHVRVGVEHADAKHFVGAGLGYH